MAGTLDGRARRDRAELGGPRRDPPALLHRNRPSDRFPNGDRLTAPDGVEIGPGVDHCARVVFDHDVHPQPTGNRLGAEVPGRHEGTVDLVHRGGQRVEERPAGRRQRRRDGIGRLGGRNQLAPHLLGQRAQQGLHQVGAVTGDLPVEAGIGELVQRRQWDVRGHPIDRAEGVEAIAEGKGHRARRPRVGVVVDVDQRTRSIP